MKTVSVAEAKAKLPSLLQAAEAGERVIVTRRGKAVAEIRSIQPEVDPDDPLGMKWLAERRKAFPTMLPDSAPLIRAMRDEEDDG